MIIKISGKLALIIIGVAVFCRPAIGFGELAGKIGDPGCLAEAGGASGSLTFLVTKYGTQGSSRIIRVTDGQRADDLVVPSNLTIRVEPTGTITGSLTTNGPLIVEPGGGIYQSAANINGPFSAGPHQVFFGTGPVSLSAGTVDAVYPQWRGARGDGAVNDTEAVQWAISAGHRVYFPKGTYLVDELKVSDPAEGRGITMVGEHREYTILRYGNAASGALLTLSTSFYHIENLTFLGKAGHSSTITGIKLYGATRGEISNCRIENFTYGIHGAGGSPGSFVNKMDHCYLYSNKRAGVYLSSTSHAFLITGQTEIAGSPWGVVKGLFRESPYVDIDYNAVGSHGEGISITNSTIESIKAIDMGHGPMGGVAVYSAPGGKGINVRDSYFEDVDYCYQAGSKFKNDGITEHTEPVYNPTFEHNFASNVHGAIFKVGRVEGGSVQNNYVPNVVNFFDTSSVGYWANTTIQSNAGYLNLYSNPYAHASGGIRLGGNGAWRMLKSDGSPLFSLYDSASAEMMMQMRLIGGAKIYNDLQSATAGRGIIVTSPDGKTTRRIGIDNKGNLSISNYP